MRRCTSARSWACRWCATASGASYSWCTAPLEVTALPGWLVVRLEDNGRGFDPQTVRPGLGLGTLYSRVTLLGGQAQVESAPGRGTQVLVRLPLLAASRPNLL